MESKLQNIIVNLLIRLEIALFCIYVISIM